jgi:hypothetical protein
MRIHLLCMLIAGWLLSACSSKSKNPQSDYSADTIQMLIMQVQKCSRLYTVEYNIHKIITHDDVIRMKGTFFQHAFNVKIPVGDRKIAIPMDAILKAYIDFSDFGQENVKKANGKMMIYLPDPKIILTNTKIDQNNVKEYVTVMRSHFSDEEMADYERQGRMSIIQSIPQLDIINKARENATRILVPMLKNMGYNEQDVIITFRKEFNSSDLRGIMDNTKIKDQHHD